MQGKAVNGLEILKESRKLIQKHIKIGLNVSSNVCDLDTLVLITGRGSNGTCDC